MDPIRLQLKDFCGYDKCDISFESFSSAIIIGKIRGNDKLSNGSGKSTIFNAIKYAIHNKVDVSALDKIVRHGTTKCSVSFEFRSSVNGEIYKVVRSKNLGGLSDLRLYRKDGAEWRDITQQRNSETEAELEKILNINYKTFCNSVLFSQMDFSGLASSTPGDRKKILKEVLQLGLYSKYELLSKNKITDLEKKIDEKRVVLSTIGNPKKDIDELIVSCKSISDDISSKTLELNAHLNAQATETEKLRAISQKIDEKEKRVAEYYAKKASLLSEIENNTLLVKDYERKLLNVDRDVKSSVSSIAKLEEEKTTLKSKQVSVEELATRAQTISQEVFDKKANLQALSMTLKDLKIPLPKESVCKYCRQEISEQSRDNCQKEIDKEILRMEMQISVLAKEINHLEILNADLNKQIKASNMIDAQVLEKSKLIEMKSNEISVKKRLYDEYKETLDRNNKRIEQSRKILQDLKSSVNDGSKEQFLKDKADRDNHYAIVCKMLESIEACRSEITTLSNKKAVLDNKIEQRKTDLSKLEEINNDIDDMSKKFNLLQKVSQAFSHSGIPALIMHSVLDDLQIESNNLLNTFRPGLSAQFFVEKEKSSGEIGDTLGLKFYLDGFELEYEQLSGAQKLIASLALKLGLATILKKRLNADMKLLLIDEVDQCLDEAGLIMFENAIKTLQKDHKVLVITHNDYLKSKFQKAIVVEQDSSFVSTASVVSSW